MNIRHSFVTAAAVAATLSVASLGCNRADDTTPVAETQTQAARTTNQPMTVSGCLRAGEAAETFVLITGGTDVATYNLVGDESVNLRDHVGRRVQVDGVLTAQQQTATRAAAPAANQPTGTSGTATVETRTALDIRQLEVRSVRPVGEDCK